MRHSLFAQVFAIVILILGVYSFPTLLGQFLSIEYDTVQQADGSIQIVVPASGTVDRQLFFSAARPRGPCRLLDVDRRVVFSNSGLRSGKSAEPLDSLFVGGTIVQDAQISKAFSWECDNVGGFGPKREFEFFITSRRAGVFLFVALIVLEGAMGLVICSSMLLIAMWLLLRQTSKKGYVFLFLTLSFLAYSISLANITHLFMSQDAAMFFHISVFSVSRFMLALFFCDGLRRSRKWLAFAAAVSLLIFVINVNFQFGSTNLSAYRQFVTIVPPLLAIISLSFTKGLTRTAAGAWLVLAIVDVFVIYSGFGKYPAPVSLAVMSIAVLYVYLVENFVSQSKERFAAAIAGAIPNFDSFQSLMKSLAADRWPMGSFRPVGYYLDQSFTNKDIQFNTHKVRFMNDSSKVFEESDLAMLPFGEYGGLIFFRPSKVRRALLSAYTEATQELSKLVAGLVFPHAEKYEPVIRKFGQGHHQANVFAVVVDINDYSTFSERYKSSFTEFISNDFIPRVKKVFGVDWIIEANKGDEVVAFFVDSSLAKISGAELELAIVNLLKFIDLELPQFCTRNGFEPITLSVGIAHGETSVVVDPIGVRFSSSAINTAKRLQERAKKNTVLSSDDAYQLLVNSNQLSFSPPFESLVKKNLIIARRVKVVAAA